MYLVPLGIKMIGDFSISWTFINKLKRYWSFSAFIVLTFIHPFYIVIIGALGPFVRIDWKKNKNN